MASARSLIEKLKTRGKNIALPNTHICPESEKFDKLCGRIGIFSGKVNNNYRYLVRTYLGQRLVRTESWRKCNEFLVEAVINTYSESVRRRILITMISEHRETVFKELKGRVIMSVNGSTGTSWKYVGDNTTLVNESAEIWGGPIKTQSTCQRCGAKIVGRRFNCEHCQYLLLQCFQVTENSAFATQSIGRK